MRRQLSPRLLYHAAERSFRGDQLLALSRGDRLLGIVWQAHDGAAGWCAGGPADGAAPGLLPSGDRGLRGAATLVAALRRPSRRGRSRRHRGLAVDGVEPPHAFAADHAFARRAGPRAARAGRVDRDAGAAP